MPIAPRGLTWDLYERLKERIRQEKGLPPTATPQSNPEIEPEFLQRLRERIEQERGQQPPNMPPPSPVAPVVQGPPRSLNEVIQRINQAGRNRVLLRATYNGIDRDLEVYSFRWRDKDDPHIPLLYAHCSKDPAHVEAFKLKKFTDMQITNTPYTARNGWRIEFA